MKTIKLTFFLIVFALSTYASDWINIRSQQPNKNKVEVISSDIESTSLKFSLDGFYKHEVITPNGIAFKLSVDKCAPLLIEGAPDLCLLASSIIIPDKNKMEIKVISSKFIEYENYSISPSKGSILRSLNPDSIPFVYGKEYSQNRFFPEKLAELREPYILRDFRGQTVLIYPFQYNPVTKVLRVYHDIVVEVSSTKESGTNEKQRLNQNTKIDFDFNNIYSHHFINYDFTGQKYDPVEEEGRMLVISYSEYMDEMQPFVEWKNQKGILTEMVDINDIGNNINSITNYVAEKYFNDGLKFVLLVGDYTHITSPIVTQYNLDNSGGADNLYGYIEGDDHYSEVIVGRFSAESEEDVITQVERTINYEKNLDETDTWLNKGLGIGSDDPMVNYQGYHDWDHIRELIRADLLDYTYVFVDEFYDGTKGGEDEPGDPTAQMLIDKFNEGIGIIVYSGHAGQSVLGTTGFSVNHSSQLSNTGMLPHIWVLGCNPGEFNSGYCLAESLARAQHNNQPAGAVTSFMSSTSQMWDPPYRAEEETVDILTEQKHIKRTAGALAINGCMEMNDYFGEAGWGWFTTDTWIFFGDPSLLVRTDIPETMTLSNYEISVGVPFIANVSSSETPVEGARVCITQNDKIFYSLTDVSGNVTINHELLPGIGKICVTAYNKITIFNNVEINSPEGAYVVYNSFELNDVSGNNDGILDYGEDVFLSLAVKNVGIESAENVMVTISTDDEYITFIDDQEIYGSIAPQEIISIDNGFEFELAENVPDEHIILFVLTASDGTDSWESYFSITAHSPILDLMEVIVPENKGFDPGETIDISLIIENSGSSEAFNVLGELSSLDPYITINTLSQQYGNIQGEEFIEKSFSITSDINTPAGHFVNFDFNMSADLGITATASFHVIVGQIPVLILDLDPNNSSGPEMQNSIESLGVSSEILTSFPDELNLYSSVFVCLGIYSSNHALSSNEGQILADYLNTGGKLYMEGGDTWYYDNATAVHPMFSLNPQADGSSDLGTINGQGGTFTDGMSFNYSGENSWIDHIDAISPAEVIFENQSPNYGCGVAYDEGGYRTIGASFEFGGLDDGSYTKEELMEQYLIFFGIISGEAATQTIELTEGYQFISSRIELENPDMLIVLQNILNENLDFVRNSNGTVLRKIGPNWVNGIGDWITTEGYLFKMLGSELLEITGEEINPLKAIELFAGYQFVSYLPTESIDAIVAFDDILNDNLDYVRNSNGEMLRKIGPNWVNGIGDLNPGQGYLIKMIADDQLVYNIPVVKTKSTVYHPENQHFIFEGGNPADPVYTLYIDGLQINDEVAIFDDDLMVGATVINSEDPMENSLAAFYTLTSSQGYTPGNEFTFKVWDSILQEEVCYIDSFENPYGTAYTQHVFPAGDGVYSIIKITKACLGVEEISNKNLSVFPNPARNSVTINAPEIINGIEIFSLDGSLIFQSEYFSNEVKLSTSEFEKGVYILKIKTASGIVNRKLVID